MLPHCLQTINKLHILFKLRIGTVLRNVSPLGNLRIRSGYFLSLRRGSLYSGRRIACTSDEMRLGAEISHSNNGIKCTLYTSKWNILEYDPLCREGTSSIYNSFRWFLLSTYQNYSPEYIFCRLHFVSKNFLRELPNNHFKNSLSHQMDLKH